MWKFRNGVVKGKLQLTITPKSSKKINSLQEIVEYFTVLD